MLTNLHGIYKGDRIELFKRLRIPWGAKMTISVEDDSKSFENTSNRFEESFGSITDPTFFEVMDNKATLITHNTQHFERIKGLDIEDWQK